MANDILITHIKGLAQVREKPPGFLAGSSMSELPVLSNSYLLLSDGRIADYGEMDSLPSVNAKDTIDASGCFVIPSFVDSHTHLVFAASREEDFVLKIKGATYAEIAARGGGILNSAGKLRTLSEEELFEKTLARAWEIIKLGTGVVEIKSGYGLTLKDEIKMLRVARRIGKETPLTVKTTFLGAHAVPQEMKKQDYIALVIDEMIPAVAEEKLPTILMCFVKKDFFRPTKQNE